MLETATIGILAPFEFSNDRPRTRSPSPQLVGRAAQRAGQPAACDRDRVAADASPFAGRTFLDAFVHLPLVLPPVVVGYLLLLTFGMRGPVGRWLYEQFGIQLIFTTAGAALATAVMTFPLMVRAIRISLEGVDRGSRMPRARSAPGRGIDSSRLRCR
jgi:hypothetical protein